MNIFQSRYKRIISTINKENINHTERTINFAGNEIKIYYIKQIIDTMALMESIIRPLIISSEYEEKVNVETIINKFIYADNIKIDNDDNKIIDYILDGMIVILLSNDHNYLIADLKKVKHRSIPEPEVTYTIRGPRDCFTENIDVNLSLIRYRLKDPKLKIDILTVGKRTKTATAVIYIEDIVNPKIVEEIKKRINSISIDTIWGTGELEGLLQNNTYDLFPQMGTTERSDWACEALVEGKVIIMADGGGVALMAPHTFSESIISCDDRYDNKFFGLFSRLIRYLALLLTLLSSPFYLALISYRTDVLPSDFIITLAQMRQSVIFPAIIDILFIEILLELVRESMLRVPTKIGPAIGIVGAIVIGQAATAAGIFSPILLIISAASFMASFAIPNYYASNPFRLLKFFLILGTSLLGIYGLILSLTIVMINLVSINSFGVPYMAPFAPYNSYDFLRSLFFSRSFSRKRMQYQKPIDDTRSDSTPLKDKPRNRFLKLFKINKPS